MSTIKVKGEASSEYTVDCFKITFSVNAVWKTSGEAVEMGKKRTEQLLQAMNDELGIKPEDLVFNDERVSHSAYQKEEYSYHKSMVLRICSDLKVVEKIAELMGNMSDIGYNIEAELSDEDEKAKIVLKSAIEDSRHKAELIASALGKKLVGAEEVNYEYTSDRSQFSAEPYRGGVSPVMENLASRLKNPVKTIKKSVDIIWNVE